MSGGYRLAKRGVGLAALVWGETKPAAQHADWIVIHAGISLVSL
ncbi:MAG: hypothetical protein WCA08_16790 [Desulfoferrobacter sp.]